MNSRLVISTSVLNFFLDNYLSDRAAKWDEPLQQVAQFADRTRNFLSATLHLGSAKKLPEELKADCEKLRAQFGEIKNFDQWVDMVFQLQSEALERQRQQSTESLYSQSLHAIRSYVVSQLQTLPEYHQKITELLQERKKIKAALYQAKQKGVPCDELQTSFNTCLKKLTALGHQPSIFYAQNQGLLANSPIRESSNKFQPLCYTPNFHEVFYTEQKPFHTLSSDFPIDTATHATMASTDAGLTNPMRDEQALSVEARIDARIAFDIKLLHFLIDHYIEIRKPIWASTTNHVVETVSGLLQQVPSHEDTEQTLQELQGRFDCMTELNDWLILLSTLTAKAFQAQKNKAQHNFGLSYILPTEDSLLSQTLHAIRSYIVAQLANNSVTATGLQEHIANLLIKVKQIKQSILHKKLENAEFKVVETLNEELNRTLLELASLGHIKSAFSAQDRGLFSDLCHPKISLEEACKLSGAEHPLQGANPYLPYCFQPNWYKIYYNTHLYKSRNYQSFNEFEQELTGRALSMNKQAAAAPRPATPLSIVTSGHSLTTKLGSAKQAEQAVLHSSTEQHRRKHH